MKLVSWSIRKLKFARNQKKELNQFSSDLDFIRSLPENVVVANKVLIIRLDDIGDYILFRNTLEPLRRSPSMANKDIWLIGNIMWKSIFDRFDSNTVNNTIWVDKSKWKEELYRAEVYKEVHNQGFETVYYPATTRRLLLDDMIAHASNAPNIYCRPFDPIFPKWQQIASSELKASIVPIDENLGPEYKLNRQFFEAALSEKWEDLPTSIEISNSPQLKIGIFIGAAHKSKRWSVHKLNKLLKLIIKHYPQYEVVILGSQADLSRSLELVKGLEKNSQIVNKTGTTSLLELIDEISTCEILITNDTSAFHISAALNIKTIVISNGVNHKRFIAYPNKNIISIYPQSFIKELKKGKYDKTLKHEGLSMEIQEIKVKTVFDALAGLLNEYITDTLV